MGWIILAVIAAILVIVAIINRKQSAAAYAALKVPGDLIKISDGLTVHAVSMGEGKYTMVMLSGWGTACPYADFYPLAEKIARHCRVIVLEVPGYGFAPDTDAPRTLDNYDREISETLRYYGIKDNVILMPHSYSGIFTFDYAKKHPDVVCALFNDDASTCHQYGDKDMGVLVNIILGVERFLVLNFGRIPFDKVMRKGTAEQLNVPKEYSDMFVTVQQHRLANKTQSAETGEQWKKNMKENLGKKYAEDLYVVNMIAVDDKAKEDERLKKSTGFTWKEAHEDLTSNPAIQKVVVMKGAQHYIHHTHADEMEKLAVELIEDLEKRA
jgi:pimeloyl-ACP methyl ester carboxylesterase